MKSEFVQPCFEGARFEEHTLPLEVARDLAAYETLVVELAKQFYLQEHQDRQRVPKGFTTDFHLHLEKIDPGSSKPMLSIVAAGALALTGGPATYFERARDLVAECIAAEGQLPPEFPKSLLTHFNQVGRSLRDDETLQLPRASSASPAVLTPSRRRLLVLAADKVYEREIELNGSIVEANWEKSSFQLRLADGTLAVVPMPESFHVQARNHGGRTRDQVTVRGVGAYDSWDHLQKVVSVESFEVQPNYELATKFEELRALEDGWHDGQGLAPEKAKLDVIADQMIKHFPNKLPLPAIVPTPEGNLLFEWSAPGDPSLDVQVSDLTAEFHAFREGADDLECEFDLSGQAEWASLFGFLTDNIGSKQA